MTETQTIQRTRMLPTKLLARDQGRHSRRGVFGRIGENLGKYTGTALVLGAAALAAAGLVNTHSSEKLPSGIEHVLVGADKGDVVGANTTAIVSHSDAFSDGGTTAKPAYMGKHRQQPLHETGSKFAFGGASDSDEFNVTSWGKGNSVQKASSAGAYVARHAAEDFPVPSPHVALQDASGIVSALPVDGSTKHEAQQAIHMAEAANAAAQGIMKEVGP